MLVSNRKEVNFRENPKIRGTDTTGSAELIKIRNKQEGHLMGPENKNPGRHLAPQFK